MTTIKKGTILKGKISCKYVKVLAVIDDLVFIGLYDYKKEIAVKEGYGTDFCTLDHITENYDIVEEDWRAEDLKEGDLYYFITTTGFVDYELAPLESSGFQYKIKSKNVFPTREKAQEYRDKIMNS